MLGIACNLIFREKYCRQHDLKLNHWSESLFCHYLASEKKQPTQHSWWSLEMQDWPTNVKGRPKFATLTFVKPERWMRCYIWSSLLNQGGQNSTKCQETFLLWHFNSSLSYTSHSVLLFLPVFRLPACLIYVSLSLNFCRYPSVYFFPVWHSPPICLYSLLFPAFQSIALWPMENWVYILCVARILNSWGWYW